MAWITSARLLWSGSWQGRLHDALHSREQVVAGSLRPLVEAGRARAPLICSAAKVAHTYSTTDDQVGAPPVARDRAGITEEAIQRLDQPGDGGKARQQSHLQVFVQRSLFAIAGDTCFKALLTRAAPDHLTHRGR